MNQTYFRTKSKEEYGLFQAIHDNKVLQLIHSFVMECEKQGSYYNRFKNDYSLCIYEWDEKEMKMKLLKEIPFTKLNSTEQKGS